MTTTTLVVRCRTVASTLLVGAAVHLAWRPACAQSTSAGRAYSAEAGKAVVDSLASLLRTRYSDADTGRQIADHLVARERAGAYTRLKDWGQFIREVSGDAQRLNGDRHLFIDYAPEGAQTGPRLPSGHGVDVVERLEGNVGYLRLSHFLGQQAAADAVVSALTILQSTDALIIDLRNARGGADALSNLLISHFTTADTVLSLEVFNRVTGTTSRRYTLRDVPGPRRPDVPLFVLTDDVSRSAAEDLPFVLQNLKRATIIGDTTAGAGRNNALYPLGYGIIGSVSYTRVMDPRTRREWERIGVIPDIPVAPESARVVAHEEALKAVIKRTSDDAAKRRLGSILEWVRAAGRTSGTASATAVGRYTGEYEGGQFVTARNGRLLYQPRVALPRVELTALSDTTFAAGAMRFRFRREAGRRVVMTVTDAEGRASEAARAGPPSARLNSRR